MPYTRLGRIILWALLLPLLIGSLDSGAEQALPEGAGPEEVWFDACSLEHAPSISLEVSFPESAGIEAEIPLGLKVTTSTPYQNTLASMEIRDRQGNRVQRLESLANLQSGINEFQFPWSPASLAPGAYTMVFEADYSDAYAPLTATIPLTRVSGVYWQQELQRNRDTLAELGEKINALRPENPQAAPSGLPGMPYLTLRHRISCEALETAEKAMAEKRWPVVSRNILYVQDASTALRAAVTFSAAQPELASVPLPAPAKQELRDGGIYMSGSPVFLFGMMAGESTALAPDPASALNQQAESLKKYGFNFMALPCPLNLDRALLENLLGAASGAADTRGLSWAVQVKQEDVSGGMMDAWPNLLEPGFVNMAQGDYNAAYRERILDILGMAQNKSERLAAMSLADNPRFKYDTEEIRKAFVAQVQEKFPDRMSLNRLWHAQLANYDEITIWGDYPKHAYQNQRAYQYEWQSFHRSLITEFFSGLKQETAASAPGVPVTISQPETAFSPGETHHSVGREDMASLMDLQACAVSFAPGDGLYAFNYPIPNAYFTLMRSYAPGKPILNLKADIDVAAAGSPEQRQSLVCTAVWESVLSGASGMALVPDSSVLQYPDALEAYARAALDVNRLGEIVMAFQQAIPEVAILFSEAAKIMDDGIPHLESARFAFEGASFAGFPIRFLTERQILAGGLDGVKVLIMPETMAISDETFDLLGKYVDAGGMVARVGTPIPYNENGVSRTDVIRSNAATVLVRGMNLPTEYLHAMDAILVQDQLPLIPRPINTFGYPIEGVRSRYVRIDNNDYLYIVNLRHDPVNVCITGAATSGRDLILARDVAFPRILASLEPMLIRLEPQEKMVASANPQ